MIGLVFACGVALVATGGATAATYFDRRPWPIGARLAIGACLAFTLLALFALPLASMIGMGPVTVALATLMSAGPMLVLARTRQRSQAASDLRAATVRVRDAVDGRDGFALIACAGYTLLALLLLAAWSQALLQSPTGIQTHSYANRHDLALHLGIISRLARSDTFPPEHPEFAGAPLTYPFLVDLGAALLVDTGATFHEAVVVQNTVLVLGLIALIYYWTRELTGSRLAGFFSTPIVLVGGGLGWVVMLRDFRTAGVGPIEFLMHIPHSYTLRDSNLQWGNLATILLLPQRSLLMGLPLALIVITLWWRAIGVPNAGSLYKSSESGDGRTMVLAGVVAGMLPLVHTHTFGVTLMAGSMLALLFPRWRLWVLFFFAAALVAVPQLLWIARNSSLHAANFFGWSPGWVHAPEPIWWFWFKNTGFFIPLLLLALVAPARLVNPTLRRFYLPFLLFLIVPNLFRLAPRMWDNNKVLIYWYVASVPLIAVLLAHMWRSGLAQRLSAIGLLISLSLAGLADTWQVASGVVTVTVFDRNAVDFAAVVQQRTPPQALIVRAPTVNHPVLLSGRRSLLGDPHRVWSHGLDSKQREADVACIYAGCADAARILERYAIDYLVVGPPERERLQVNEAFLRQFPVAEDAGGYRLHRVKPEHLVGVTPDRQTSLEREALEVILTLVHAVAR